MEYIEKGESIDSKWIDAMFWKGYNKIKEEIKCGQMKQ